MKAYLLHKVRKHCGDIPPLTTILLVCINIRLHVGKGCLILPWCATIFYECSVMIYIDQPIHSNLDLYFSIKENLFFHRL